MRRMNILYLLISLISVNAQGQSLGDSLRQEFLLKKEIDQFHRNQIGSIRSVYGSESEQLDSLWQVIHRVDSLNTDYLVAVIEEHGWPGDSLVGSDGTKAAFLILQHADRHPTAQSKYLPVVIDAAERGELNWLYVAYLIDRVRLYKENRNQVYGTQLQLNEDTGLWEVVRLEDPENVDLRRTAVGLFPLQQYLDMYNKK